MYAIGEFAKMIKRAVRTLQAWDREGKLNAKRTPTGRRYYTHDQYLDYMGMSSTSEGKCIVYMRVSSPSQKDDLVNQRRSLELFCQNGGYSVDEWIKDVGSALNYKRPGFIKLLREVEHGKVRTIYLAHKDRLVRFGYEWFASFCEEHGTKIVTMEHETLSPQEEIVKDVLTILHVFSCRIYGLRKYRDEISKKVQSNDKPPKSESSTSAK